MDQAVYERLKEVARTSRTTTYGEVAPQAGLDMGRPDHRNRMSELLDEISSHEHAHGRPLLSAVVVRGDNAAGGLPGPGFFTLARRLGAQRADEDNVAFFARELTRVYDAWRPPAR